MSFKLWTISDALPVQVKYHTECQSLKEELGKANGRLLSMEEVVNCFASFQLTHEINLTSVYFKQDYKREVKQLKHDNEVNCNTLESKLR
jgi:deoxyribodipyrimidine photolyase